MVDQNNLSEGRFGSIIQTRRLTAHCLKILLQVLDSDDPKAKIREMLNDLEPAVPNPLPEPESELFEWVKNEEEKWKIYNVRFQTINSYW
jgi:hypothetical protein